MKEIKELIQALGPILTVMSTLIAVWLTQKWNRQTQSDLLEQQLMRDEMKEKRNEIKETLEVYNQVLKLDGEFKMITYLQGPITKFDFGINNREIKHIVEFDLDTYQKEFRPIIYEKYHLLHDDVAKVLSRIDDHIKRCSYYGDITRDDHDVFCDEYTMLVSSIMVRIYEFRKGIYA